MLEQKSGLTRSITEIHSPKVLVVVTRNIVAYDFAVKIDLAAGFSDPIVDVGILADYRSVRIEQSEAVKYLPPKATEINSVHVPALPAEPEVGAADPQRVG